jgi:FG-GAP-like repeat
VRVPSEAGNGNAKVTLSFPDWKDGNVTPVTFAVPIVQLEPKSGRENRKRQPASKGEQQAPKRGSSDVPRPLFEAAPGSPITVAGRPQNLVVGDIDKDGKPDLVVACKEGHLAVLLGDGKGGFRLTKGSPVKLTHSPGEMALGDINGDGNLDLVVADHSSYAVSVLLGDGKGSFKPAPGSPFVMKKGEHPHTHGLALADVNGDDKLDLITANTDDNDVAVLLGDGQGGFRPAPGSLFAVGQSPYPLAVGDMNGDGKLDIITPNSKPGERTLTVLLGDGRGSFRPASGSPFATAGQPYYVALGDINGDGKPDVVAAHNDDGRVTILLGDGKGGFKSAPHSPVDLGSRAWGLVVTDVNGDGKADLVAATGETVRVLLGDGHGSFAAAPGSPFPAGKGTWRLVVADLNGDGKPDIAATSVESDQVTVLLGK